MKMARNAVNLILVEKGLDLLVAVVPGDEALNLRFGEVGKLRVNLTFHGQLSLIERGLIVIRFIRLAHVSGHQITTHQRPMCSVWAACRLSPQADWLVPGKARSGERHCTQLSGRGRAWAAQHRAGEHLQIGRGAISPAVGTDGIFVEQGIPDCASTRIRT